MDATVAIEQLKLLIWRLQLKIIPCNYQQLLHPLKLVETAWLALNCCKRSRWAWKRPNHHKSATHPRRTYSKMVVRQHKGSPSIRHLKSISPVWSTSPPKEIWCSRGRRNRAWSLWMAAVYKIKRITNRWIRPHCRDKWPLKYLAQKIIQWLRQI